MQTPAPTSLLVHDGELADVCALMARLGLEFTERRGSATSEDEAHAWDLVISTPRRLLEFTAGAAGAVPTRIAFLDKDSKTLRAMLQRAGIDLVVRRPVHPVALRLLILHCLYRGPEKRRSLRVSVGARVRIRVGLRRQEVILADLSVSGCRLLVTRSLERGRKVRLSIPAEVTLDKSLSVTGHVVRIIDPEAADERAVAIAFTGLSPKLQTALRQVVSLHTQGPAALDPTDSADSLASAHAAGDEVWSPAEAPPAAPAPVAVDLPAPEPRRGPMIVERNPPPAPAAAPRPAAPASKASGNGSERRTGTRHLYSDHVVALGVEAARVLIGRDISLGGMRVEPHPDVGMGDQLRIALHLRAREPLVVQARVTRDDGERGLVLQFHDLSETTRSYLTKMVNFLPILAVRAEGETGAGVVVSEILARESAGA